MYACDNDSDDDAIVVRCSYVDQLISCQTQDLLAMLVELLTDIQTSRTALVVSTSRRRSSHLLIAITVCVTSLSSSSSSCRAL